MSSWLRTLLNRRLTVRTVAELIMWTAVGYLSIGLTWSFLHPDDVQRVQERLQQQIRLPIEATYQLAALGEASVVWPVIPILPSPGCEH